MQYNKVSDMMQIEIHKKSGDYYRAAVPTLKDVQKLAEIRSISQIFLFAITPREYKHLQSLDLPKKIKIIR